MRVITLATALLLGSAMLTGLRAQRPVEPWTVIETSTPETGRGLTFIFAVPEAPEAALRRWTNNWEARRFLGAEVRIDPWVGGRYEVLFDPDNDPAGALAGTYGSKIVALEAPTRLVFQWNCPTPRVAARDVGGRRVLQESLVEVTFQAIPGRTDATRVTVHHYGMGEDPDWNASYRYYRDSGWPWILNRLRTLYGQAGGGDQTLP